MLDLVRTEAKAAYRECDVVQVAEDSRVVLGATGTAGFRIEAPTPATVRDLANGAAPLGLALARPRRSRCSSTSPSRTTCRGAVGGFRAQHRPRRHHPVHGRRAGGRLQHATDDEVVAILNRELVANGVPVRALSGTVRAEVWCSSCDGSA